MHSYYIQEKCLTLSSRVIFSLFSGHHVATKASIIIFNIVADIVMLISTIRNIILLIVIKILIG